MGNFQKGTWTQIPTNCTREYNLTYTRCAEYGTIALTECVSYTVQYLQKCVQWAWQTAQQCIAWATQTTQSCVSWASTTSQQCCDWWPCSWGCQIFTTIVSWACLLWSTVVDTVCVGTAAIVSLVCTAVAVVAIATCLAFATTVWTFCLLWGIVEIIFCLSSANGGTAFLLTDGTVMMQECKSVFGWFNLAWPTRRWWKLVPNNMGSYVNGSWVRLADSNLARKYFASAVLADGLVLVCGGEYSDASGTLAQDENNTCEIYDPVANTWTTVSSPLNPDGTTWSEIGDSPCCLLPDGTLLVGSQAGGAVAKFDPTTMTWTAKNGRTRTSEESWVLMPDNTIAAPQCMGSPATLVYDIASDTWNAGNALGKGIVDVGSETGPALLLYDGTAFFLGANQHTAVYSAGANPQWSNGMDLPQQNGKDIGIVDGPAALLVDGSVLFGAAPIDKKGGYNGPCFYFEFDGTTYNRTNDLPNNGCPTYVTRMLLLPDGNVMCAREDDSSFYLYTPASATPQNTWRPVIQSAPASVTAGTTIQVSGFQFNGLSQATAYGDDSQTATNYPLVRITNNKSGHVKFCRTFNHTTVDSAGNNVASMGVATGMNQLITTSVAIPLDIEAGESSLVVIANGIPSETMDVSVSNRQKGHGK